ncbi:MAG: hypothetical protein KDM64_14735, partial [Verrucomicrobiae bacterium]|nr:hypothetical protein [Verrucomicrobiae bacterium]
MHSLQRFTVAVVHFFLRFSIGDRMIRFLAWQRRRVIRQRVEARLVAEGAYPNEVVAGPFAGMKLPGKNHYVDARFEKTFGAYEQELFPALFRLAADPGRFRSLINIGAADGFFAVGLARSFPAASVLAFEMQEAKQATLREVARLNEVETRLELRGRCSIEDLNQLNPALPALVVCDVDGFEEILLDPEKCPVLKGVDLLIETHDCYVDGITST